MIKNRPGHRPGRRGAAALEFGLILPVLIAVFGSIIELSLYISTMHRVNRVARDAARVGSTVIEGDDPTGELIEEAADGHALLALDAADLACTGGCQVEVVWELDADSGYYFINVEIVYPYSGVMGVLPMLQDRGVTSSFAMVTPQQ